MEMGEYFVRDDKTYMNVHVWYNNVVKASRFQPRWPTLPAEVE